MRKSSILFLVLAVLFSCKAESERILIKLTKGQKYNQKMVSKMTTSQTIMGKKVSTTVVSEAVNVFEVLDVTDSIYTFKVTYESLSAKVIAGGVETSMAQGPVTELFNKLKGQSYQLKMSNTGRVVESMGADSIFVRLTSLMPGQPEEMKSSLANSFIKNYGDSAIKKNSFQNASVYPKKEVKEGDSWSVKKAAGGDMFSPAVDAVYKVDKITGDEYTISMKTNITIDGSTPASPMFNVKFSGTMNSISKIDKSTGLVTESKMTQDMMGNMKVTQGTPSTAGTSILTQIKSEMTMTNTLIK